MPFKTKSQRELPLLQGSWGEKGHESALATFHHLPPNYFSLLVNTRMANKGYFNIHKQILLLLKIIFSFISQLLGANLLGRSTQSSGKTIKIKCFDDWAHTLSSAVRCGLSFRHPGQYSFLLRNLFQSKIRNEYTS